MNKNVRALAVLSLVSLSLVAAAPAAAQTPSSAPSVKGVLAQLAFMAGDWGGPDGTLTARIEGTRNGKPAAREWTWRRMAKEAKD